MIEEQHRLAVMGRIHKIPIVSALNLRIEELDKGICRAIMPRDTRYDGIFESTHGGLLMTVADTISCFAILTMTKADEILTTTDMGIRFLAPCLTDLTAVARVIKLGRTICPVQIDLSDSAGKPVAIAQVAYMRLESMPKR
ncbi:MAG: PaaI family thioesterase [candidate division Zixibacteria bacterium]|nr:PaaI family thioesterase [candidate division Zixibacteria bacterium]